MYYILYFIAAFFLAELISGIFHWWEDRYGNPDWPLVGKYIIKPNIEHHKHMTKFCRGSYLYRNATTLIPCILLASLFYYFQLYFLVLTMLIVSQSNEIHCWSHLRCNKFIRFFQDLGLLQSPRQHSIHHTKPFNRYYCVLSNYSNPVLDKLFFWNILEYIVSLFGASPRKERELA
jgi:hypothetical protein